MQEADQIGANDSTCCVRQRKTNCGHVYYRGATTANSDHAAVVWELSWSAAHLKCCRSVCNSTEYELQPVWVHMCCTEPIVQIQYRVRFTGYARWDRGAAAAPGHSQMRLARSGTCINNISALSSSVHRYVYVPRRILLPSWYWVVGRR